MTTIALSKARGTLLRPVRCDEALEGLSDPSQWLLDTLRGWRRSLGHHQLAGAHEPRDIGGTRATALYPSSKPLWKE